MTSRRSWPQSGSSPRGRGTPDAGELDLGGCRFIPARAGNTSARESSPGAGAGSSPRGRGTHIPHPQIDHRERFIPARAGNTRRDGRRQLADTVHPRAGGEHASRSAAIAIITGSSPRGRGTRPRPRRPRRDRRFIPARAGNTCSGAGSRRTYAVHPRAGGEHTHFRVGGDLWSGSSPRGRGTRRGGHGAPERSRFIPARAGNTPRRTRASPTPAVHPRAGGEHWPLSGAVCRWGGSSPRGRGTPDAALEMALGTRFIPARAGNTRRARSRWSTSAVHPRAGGEHTAFANSYYRARGSSPRGRGTRVQAPSRAQHRRFIPARAGNTRRPGHPGREPPVHPRAGGEHTILIGALATGLGSSPRGRGTRKGDYRGARVLRFIPARAGNTAAAGPGPG